jgi:hypothetical protein
MVFHKVCRESKKEAFRLEYINALHGYGLMLTRNSIEAEASSPSQDYGRVSL